MNTEIIVQEIAERYGLRRRGKLYAGPCPECGGSKSSDKFNIRPDGGYKCYACGITGDIITWLRKFEGMNCPDAHDRAGKECRKANDCQAREHCRYGKKSGKTPQARRNTKRRSSRPFQQQERSDRRVAEISPEFPKREWLSWAEPFTEKAHQRLLKNDEQLAYLAARGIDQAAVERFYMGWIPHQYQVLKKQIGLSIDDGKEKLWVPAGLLIPVYDHGGGLHRIRVRRPPAELKKFLPKLKYVWLKGSGNLPYAIYPENKPRGAVIVEAELDGMAVASAHSDVVVTAIGTLQGGVGPALYKQLQDLPVILVALDAEENSKEAIQAWKRTFRHAKYWGTLSEKDPGDFFKAGGNLNEWIEKGLPPKITTKRENTPPQQDGAFSPARKQDGGGGEENNIDEQRPPEFIEITLTNGHVIYLVDSKNTVWERLSSEGKPVFTRYELEKLKAATAAMTKEERIKAAMAAIEAKEVFGGYISRGESYGV